MADRPRADETTDPAGARVVLDGRVWDEKIARDHPEVAYRDDALRAVSAQITSRLILVPRIASASTCAASVPVVGYLWS
jgi:hypothetical protein